MSEEKTSINVSSSSVVPTEKNTKIQLEQNEKIIIRRATNHNEISIMETDWNQIKKKIFQISFTKRLDIFAMLYGATVPYIINIISALVHKETPNYAPLVICIILILSCKFFSKYIPYLSEHTDTENSVHLSDLKNIIEQVDTTSNDR